MLDLIPDCGSRRALRVLCVGAHCDDIEIGCGATLRLLGRERQRLVVDWAILSGTTARRNEASHAMRLLVAARHRGTLRFGTFADGRFPSEYAPIKDYFESLKTMPSPDLVLCHEREDRHQDHRIVNEMTWNTFRDHLILEYEIPKWDGGLGQPNVYVPVGARDAEAKARTLLSVYASQAHRDWFSRDTFLAAMRLRGIECRAPSGYAEAFHGRKLRIHGG
ncbi:MAG: PIG-L deacetylase family protein [Burkholderiales bacterium]